MPKEIRHKTCLRCGKLKPDSEFPALYSGACNMILVCKECRSKGAKR